eukprot:TRINITY_DN13912_c0_g1_i1.p1 TRINITY_DN13912_c0_g1~~TRINITY_DN13912_c0_g1_i1.p1  ORF type:complete len:263 (-),score=21.61 TRINITY_DN13912_c0_g1_i1:1163-1951(-)
MLSDNLDFSQFGGSAFITPAPLTTTPQRLEQTSTLRCVNVKRIRDALADTSGDDRIQLDGSTISNVCVCGKVNSSQQQENFYTYDIHDGSGQISVRKWIMDDADTSSALATGGWVRIFGTVKRDDDSQIGAYIQAFAIRQVEDPSEILYHQSRIIYEHIQLSRMNGVQVSAKLQFSYTPMKSDEQLQHTAKKQKITSDSLENAVIELLKKDESTDGMYIGDITTKLQSQFSQYEISQALQNMAISGKVYTTLDDDHYKSIQQ